MAGPGFRPGACYTPRMTSKKSAPWVVEGAAAPKPQAKAAPKAPAKVAPKAPAKPRAKAEAKTPDVPARTYPPTHDEEW